jgi:hypothetical protein
MSILLFVMCKSTKANGSNNIINNRRFSWVVGWTSNPHIKKEEEEENKKE